MMKYLITFAACLTLVACDTPLGTEIARDQAKGVVNDVVESKVPGIDATPVTDCVIDNASGSEIVEIAGAAVTGIQDSTVDLVLDIATRHETINCFRDQVGPLVIAGLIAASF